MGKIYGIDLGTTNSLIGYNDKLCSGLVPSIADTHNKIAGEKLRNDYTAERSFKINMSLGNEGLLSIASSALVLNELKRLAEESGEKVEDVVISVPAYFSDNQRQATVKAANLAKLNVKALVNEPTAAAMYFNKNRKSLTLVYDLGGGTFDVSVIDSRLGTYDVQATDGLVIGGDNLDEAILKYIWRVSGFKPHRIAVGKAKEVKDKMKCLCEKVKLSLQRTGQSVFVDLSNYSEYCDNTELCVSVDTYKAIMKTVFAPTIAKTKQVIAEAITHMDVYDLLLVGGSTRDPFLQEWIADEIGKKPVEVSYDPDKIVAQGACLYAYLVETGEVEVAVSDVTKALGIGMDDGTVKLIIQKNSKLPIEDFTIVTNPVDSTGIELKIYQGDSILAENNECIGEMMYDFNETIPAYKAHVKVTLSVNVDGIVTVKAKQSLKKEVVVKLKRI
jgi:molecular chaperone DnaK (HSP70)